MAEHLVRQSAQDEFGRTAPEPAGSGISATWLPPTFTASPRPYEVGRNEAEEDHEQAWAGAQKPLFLTMVRPLPCPVPAYPTRAVFNPAGAGRGRCQEQLGRYWADVERKNPSP